MNNHNLQNELGSHIMNLRKKRNLSRSQLAEGICSVSYISRIENSNRLPSSIILVQIAKKLGVAPDYLLMDIESENSAEARGLINELVLLIERHDFKSIYNSIIDKEKTLVDNFESFSLVDRQIIETLKTYSYYMLNKNYTAGLRKTQRILEMTYIPGNTPTDIEFALMELSGFFLLLDGKKEEAYIALSSIEKYVYKINFLQTNFMIPRFYSHLIMACLETNRLTECDSHLDHTIDFCKKENTSNSLRELYYLKSELSFRLGNMDESRIWYEKAFQLHDLIKTSDHEYFEEFVRCRVERMRK